MRGEQRALSSASDGERGRRWSQKDAVQGPDALSVLVEGGGQDSPNKTNRRACQRSRGRFHLSTEDLCSSPGTPVGASPHPVPNSFQYFCDSRHLLLRSYG